MIYIYIYIYIYIRTNNLMADFPYAKALLYLYYITHTV